MCAKIGPSEHGETVRSRIAGFPAPFRRGTRSSDASGPGNSNSLRNHKNDQIVVFIRSSDEVYLKNRDEVLEEALKTPPLLSEVDLPRYPWSGEKDIYIPTKSTTSPDAHPKCCKCCEWAATIELDTISPSFRFRRVAGNVKKLYVFEKPLGK